MGGPSHGARVWCLGRVPKHRNWWQEVEGLLFSPKKLSVGAYFELLFLGCGFLIHLSNRYDSTRFRAPWKKIHQKIRDTTGTVLIQGPSIVLLVWRSIMFNGSFLRVYRILRFVKAVVSLLIFPTGPIALDCEPRGRRYTKNTGHDRNRLY